MKCVQPPSSSDMSGAAPFGSPENDEWVAWNLDFSGLHGPDVVDSCDASLFL